MAQEFSLPLLVEELGYRATSKGPTPDDERAEVFRALLGAVHALGLGAFPWMIGETGRENFDGLLIRPSDENTFSSLRCE